jgi:hypothetical protein
MHFDQDLWDFDYSLWRLLQELANRSAFEAGRAFGISMESAREVEEMSNETIKSLASGIASSFSPKVDERQLESALMVKKDALELMLNRTGRQVFDANFWLLLGRTASINMRNAQVRYGVSEHVARVCGDATTHQLRLLSSQMGAAFELRFPHRLITEFARDGDPERFLSRKYVYCLK